MQQLHVWGTLLVDRRQVDMSSLRFPEEQEAQSVCPWVRLSRLVERVPGLEPSVRGADKLREGGSQTNPTGEWAPTSVFASAVPMITSAPLPDHCLFTSHLFPVCLLWTVNPWRESSFLFICFPTA